MSRFAFLMDPSHERRYLYHYTGANVAFAEILAKGRLRLSPYSKMRDPLEAGRLNLGGVFWATDAASDGEREANYLVANDRIGSLRLTSKLLSLSVDANVDDYSGSAWVFGRGWARARMWEQYADLGRGVCLAFDCEVLRPFVLAQLQQRDPRSFDGSVSYTEEGVSGDVAADLHPQFGQTWEELVDAHLEQFAEALFLTKILDWESEHEYRFVEFSEDDTFSFVDYGDALAAVILGHEFPDWQTPGALAVAETAAVPVFRLRWSLGRPEVNRITGSD